MKWFKGLLEKFRNYKSEHGYSCDICEKELFDYPKHRLCKDCENALFKNDGSRCPVCGRKTVAAGVCLTCKAHFPVFEKGFSPLVYDGTSASVVNRFKNGERYLCYLLAERMAEDFIRETGGVEPENAIVAAVPATDRSQRERGYNQAAELAKVFAEKTGLCYEPELLKKGRETKMQKKGTAKERAENVSGAFRVHQRTGCRGKTVVLVDDIMTTGSTGSECARVLKNAGADEVLFVAASSVREKR